MGPLSAPIECEFHSAVVLASPSSVQRVGEQVGFAWNPHTFLSRVCQLSGLPSHRERTAGVHPGGVWIRVVAMGGCSLFHVKHYAQSTYSRRMIPQRETPASYSHSAQFSIHPMRRTGPRRCGQWPVSADTYAWWARRSTTGRNCEDWFYEGNGSLGWPPAIRRGGRRAFRHCHSFPCCSHRRFSWRRGFLSAPPC